MKGSIMLLSFLGAISLGMLLSSCTHEFPSSSLKNGSSKKLRVVALSDLHGSLETELAMTGSNQLVKFGGAALLSSYIRELKNDGTPTIILDAGDMFQGSLISNSSEGASVIKFLNFLEVDASVIGNHDFDFGPIGPNSISKRPQDDPRGALKARMAEAHFPFLSANIRSSSGTRPDWAPASVLITKSGIKIGVIGFSTPKTPETTVKNNVEDLSFVDPVDPIIQESTKLRTQGADFILLVGHEGGDCSDNRIEMAEDLTTCKPSDLFRILDRLPEGTVDLVIGGHTHQGIVKFYKQTPVLQAKSNARYFGYVELELGRKAELHPLVEVCQTGLALEGRLTCDPRVVPKTAGPLQQAVFLGKAMVEDPDVLKLMDDDVARVQSLKEKEIGIHVLTPMKVDFLHENPLGNFFADVLNQRFQNVDLVLLNNGGLRADLPSGKLDYGHLFSILPFDNRLAIVTVPGVTLKKMIEMGLRQKNGGLSWSALTFSASQCSASEILIHGLPWKAQKSYRVLMPDFLAQGGIDFDRLGFKADQIQILEEQDLLRDEMASALKDFRGRARAEIYFDPKTPRQKINGTCESDL